MHVRFIGDPTERDGIPSRRSISLFGVDFHLDQLTDVSELVPKAREQLARHSHFEVVDVAPVAAFEIAAEAPADVPSPSRASRKKPAEE